MGAKLPCQSQAFFIHGTNSSNKIWKGEVRDSIRNIFGHATYADSIELRGWSGANNSLVRKLAADSLIEHILHVRTEHQITETRVTIVGHSHGGNVALLASDRLRAELGEKVEINIVSLNAPSVVGGANLVDSSIRLYHIYSLQDQIVRRAGFGKTGVQERGGEKRVWPGVPNGGEFSFAKNFNSGLKGSTQSKFPQACANIGYKDQYKFKGLKPKIHISAHKGWLPKNVREWSNLLRKAVEEMT
jgi:pimeloyl-ACP methyl ester carboxylesterase